VLSPLAQERFKVKSRVKTAMDAMKSVFALMGSPPFQRFYLFRRLWLKRVYREL
jgi:hypothetical protein